MSEKIVQLNEEVIKGQIKELVRGSVEETLNELLEKEAESLTQAARYERSKARQGYRSGHYDRNLTTTSGDVTLHMPRLKGVSFETAIIERYRRRESSVEEALIEMYLAGVSVRRVEDITEALWGSKVSPATISELNKKAYVHIEDWRNRPLQGGRYPYVYVDGIYLRRNWGGEYENVSGNVKKCAVGKYPKSEKHGNTAQFSEVERSGTQENCGGIGSGCRLRLRPLPVLRRRQSQRVARIDPNAVVVDKNIAENDRFDLFSR